MTRLHCGFSIAAVLLAATLAAAQTPYFPSHAFDPNTRHNNFVSGWYSGQLRAIRNHPCSPDPKTHPFSPTDSSGSGRFIILSPFVSN